MRARKSLRPVIAILLILIFFVILGGFIAVYHFNSEIEIFQRSSEDADAAFQAHLPNPFINSAMNAEPYRPAVTHDDALYYYEAPEGFTIISHSYAWNDEMLALLRRELLKNVHGDEINLLHEIIVYPYDEEVNALASYTLGTTTVSFFIGFPAFPDDFTVNFPQEIGRINLYGGDNKTTIDSIAESLSHEYGHLYTFYYMFPSGTGDIDSSSAETDDATGVNNAGSVGWDERGALADTIYAKLRGAERFNLITNAVPGEFYMQERHRYLVEVAAEDYIQLMGSPTTRQIVDFVDVQQVLRGAEHPLSILGARNAFPQENMTLPLAFEVPGLVEYFYDYIGVSPRIPIDEKQDIILHIEENTIQHNLVTGLRTFTHFEITWNTPYQNTIYTLICYDPHDYSGWGIPIKTVRPGQAASAVIGEFVIVRGDQVVSMDDGLAEGTKVFLVVALLPDGTFYSSEKLEYTFD